MSGPIEEICNGDSSLPIIIEEFEKELMIINHEKVTRMVKLHESGWKYKLQLVTEQAISKKFVKSRIITLPKKGTIMQCTKYTTISVLPHTLKILSWIVKDRIKIKMEQYVSENKFGFWSGRGTSKAYLSFKSDFENNTI